MIQILNYNNKTNKTMTTIQTQIIMRESLIDMEHLVCANVMLIIFDSFSQLILVMSFLGKDTQ